MFRRKRKESDFGAEIESHLQLETQRLREQGLSDEEAQTTARRAFGNVTHAQERYYESGRWLWWDHLWKDLRFALRILRKSPGFAAVAIVTLGLGIGASTAIFSVVDAVLLRALPYPNPDKIVRVWEQLPNGHPSNLADLNFDDFRTQNDTFSHLAVYGYSLSSVSGGSEPVRINIAVVSSDFF